MIVYYSTLTLIVLEYILTNRNNLKYVYNSEGLQNGTQSIKLVVLMQVSIVLLHS